MSTKKKSTALAVIGENPMQLVQLLDQKISEMKTIEDTKWKTSGTISISGMSIDLKTETKIENLIKVNAAIRIQEEAYTESQRELGVKSAPAFTASGHLREDWKADIKLRIAIINQKEELDTLKALQSEASEFITKDEKKAAFMEKMANYLASK
jgi:hypothetical protein